MEFLKEAFVEAAKEELISHRQEVNLSRISVVTGLQRKDINRIEDGDAPGSEGISLFAKVIGAWISDRRFSKGGKPRPLYFEGAQSEFAELVLSVSKDLNPYTVLFELERTKAVRKIGAQLRLVFDTYVPSADAEKGLSLLATDTSDLILAVEENIFSPRSTPHLHIATRYDNVCIEKLDKIRLWFLQEGALLHSRAQRFLSQYDKDLNPALFEKKGGGSVVIGTFSRVSEPRPSKGDAQGSQVSARRKVKGKK